MSVVAMSPGPNSLKPPLSSISPYPPPPLLLLFLPLLPLSLLPFPPLPLPFLVPLPIPSPSLTTPSPPSSTPPPSPLLSFPSSPSPSPDLLSVAAKTSREALGHALYRSLFSSPSLFCCAFYISRLVPPLSISFFPFPYLFLRPTLCTLAFSISAYSEFNSPARQKYSVLIFPMSSHSLSQHLSHSRVIHIHLIQTHTHSLSTSPDSLSLSLIHFFFLNV